MNSVLILGASGTVGGHLVRQLADQHKSGTIRVVAAFRSDAAGQTLRALGVATARVDLDDPASIASALQGIQTVFVLKPYDIRMLVHGKSVVDAAVKAAVRTIVNLGVLGPDDSNLPLVVWHQLIEAYAARSGLGCVNLRPTFFMDALMGRVDFANGRVYNLTGDARVSWVAATDIARVAANVIRDPSSHHGKTYPLATDVASVPEIAAWLQQLTGTPFAPTPLAGDQAIELMIKRGRQPDFARAVVEFGVAAGNIPSCREEHANVQPLTGVAPTRFRDFLADVVARRKE